MWRSRVQISAEAYQIIFKIQDIVNYMISITELSEKDKSKLAKLLRSYWRERGFDIKQKWALNYLTEGHAEEIRENKFFTIKLNKKVIGNISVIIQKGEVAKIKDFVINEENRRKGHGTEALKFAILYCKSKGIRKIYSLIFPEYMKFYKKFNFIEEGYLKNHFKEGEDLIFVSKFLEKEKQLSLKDEISKINIKELTSKQMQSLRYK